MIWIIGHRAGLTNPILTDCYWPLFAPDTKLKGRD